MRDQLYSEIISGLDKDSIFTITLQDKKFIGYGAANIVFQKDMDILFQAKSIFNSMILKNVELTLHKKLNPYKFISYYGMYEDQDEQGNLLALNRLVNNLKQFTHIFLPSTQVENYRNMLSKIYQARMNFREVLDEPKIIIIDDPCEPNIYLYDSKIQKVNIDFSFTYDEDNIIFNWSMLLNNPNVVELFINY